MKNEHNWYKNNVGSCIVYDVDNKRWILTVCGEESIDAEYSAFEKNNNKMHPNGEWLNQTIQKSCIEKIFSLNINNF